MQSEISAMTDIAIDHATHQQTMHLRSDHNMEGDYVFIIAATSWFEQWWSPSSCIWRHVGRPQVWVSRWYSFGKFVTFAKLFLMMVWCSQGTSSRFWVLTSILNQKFPQALQGSTEESFVPNILCAWLKQLFNWNSSNSWLGMFIHHASEFWILDSGFYILYSGF